MLNTIKMDLYRAFKSKCFYITILIAAICFITSIASMKFASSEIKEMAQEEAVDDTIQNIGITMGSILDVSSDEFTVDDVLPMLFGSGTVLVMGAIFCVVFVCMDHSSGYIKNVVSKKNYRNQTSISKAITMIIYTIVEVLVCFGAALLSILIFFQKIRIDDIGAIAGYLGTQSMIQVALLTLCILVCNLLRNIGFAMAFAICMSAGLFSLVPQLLDHFKLPVTLSNYVLSIVTKTLPLQYDSTLYLRAIVVSVVSILVYQLASTVIMKRQDIK